MTKVYKTTPVGRIVAGNAPIGSTERKTDSTTKAPKFQKDGVTPQMECYIGLAFAKNDPAWIAFKRELAEVDRSIHPRFFDAQGQRIPQMIFADKIIDGDGYTKEGKAHAEKEGYAGHEVLMMSSGFEPQLTRHDGQRWVDTPLGSIKRGDHAMAYFATSDNGSKESPGVYRNLEKIAFCWAGKEIVGGVDANTAFAAPPPAPAGASTTPQAPAMTHAAPPPAPAPAAAAPAAPPPAPAAAPAPAYDGYMAAPAAPAPAAPPPAPAAPAAPAGPVMTAAATTTYEAYQAAGWTDAMLIEHGKMLPR